MTTPPLGVPGGFKPPPYPYARLSKLLTVASRHEGGVVDLSVGTPCDPPPPQVTHALCASKSLSGYPSSVGSEALRGAAADWMRRRFGVETDPQHIAACVGTKEMVASTAWYMRLRDPARDVVIGPAVAYPTYAMGAQLAGCSYVPVPTTESGAMDLSVLPDELTARTLLVWANSPSNPTGSLCDLDAVASWAQAKDVPVFSDECYVEFTWDDASCATVLRGAGRNVVAVHSLSKRSNMAGMRVGFYAGDPEIVGYLAAIRQHSGLMVPGPVQEAAVAALCDDEHVEIQRLRYLRRLERLVEILHVVGLDAELPKGGFYLWVPVPGWCTDEAESRGDGAVASWILTEALAEAGGVVVSPGDLYGDGGSPFVRVAAVQPDDRIELLAKRLAEPDSLRRH